MPDRRPDDLDPYAPPKSPLGPAMPEHVDADAVALRREYLGRESFLRALGLAYLVSAAINGLAFASALLVFWLTGKLGPSKVPLPDRYQTAQFLNVCIGTPASVMWFYALGWGLRKLRRWAFWGHFFSAFVVVVVLFVSIIRGDLGGPMADKFAGDLLCFAVMAAQLSILFYQVACPNWRVVRQDYRAAVDATPHLDRRLRWPFLLGVVPLTIVVTLGGWAMAAYIAWKITPMLAPAFRT